MSVYFLDSSALVKRYVSEIGSDWVVDLCNPTLKHDVFITAITAVEITAAISRRSRAGSINIRDAITVYHQLKNDLKSEYQVIEVTDSIINLGMGLAEYYVFTRL